MTSSLRVFLEQVRKHPQVRIFCGHLTILRYDGTVEQTVPAWDYSLEELLGCRTGISQSSTFIHREAYQRVGLLDVNDRYTMDHEWLVRAMHQDECVRIPHVLTFSRRRRASIMDANLVRQSKNFLAIRRRHGQPRLSSAEFRIRFYLYTDWLRRMRWLRRGVRRITFIGGVGPLYSECLKDCLRVIEQWNRQQPSFRLRLLLMTYPSPALIAREVGVHPDLEVLIRPPPEDFSPRMQTSWAVFVPYSFGSAERVMVTCSFPTKLTDAALAGRPVLVYGPAYASLPRYFAENHRPICVLSREGLGQAVRDIGTVDSPALIERCQSVVQSFHSPGYLRRTLAVEAASPAAGDPSHPEL